ncbi:hypothetical protein SteCoe_5954 [Stentor coeruleus]|uniref:Uncharacterized protein n=1 Tax=Stentor coeruleus TaxID=5963 RepID=A0A1R2CR69_9CILI|nr:hypothetical protein SteCoe_5954 [Stentor coeruleus]
MEVLVSIVNAEFTKQSFWFIQVELEEQKFSSKQKIKQKQRTDVFYGFNPRFLKNFFSFGASLANKITLKFGAIEVQNYSEIKPIDPSKCICQGVYILIITKKILATLRDQVSYKTLYRLINQSTSEETAILTVNLSLRFSGVEEQIIEDERVFLKIEYDRYENDEETIKNKLADVEVMLQEKNSELQEWMKKVDHLRDALRSLGTDVAMLKKEKDYLELENSEIQKRIERLSKVDDMHIKFDILSTSLQGVDILKLILEKTNKRFQKETLRHKELSANWMKIEGKKRKLEELKNEVEKVKEAHNQLEFHMLTLKDQLPQALVLRENVKNLDGLIKEFENQIIKARVVKKDKANEVEVVNLKHQKAVMEQKHKQLEILLDTNDGFLPIEELAKLNFDMDEDKGEKEILKKRGEDLLNEIERLGQEMSTHSFRPSSSNSNKIELQVKLQAAQARVDAMQKKMTEQASIHAQEIAKYEALLLQLDAKLVKSY